MADNNTTLSSYTQSSASNIYGMSLSETIDARASALIGNFKNRIPAIVQSYDYTTNSVIVSIAINSLGEKLLDGSVISYETGMVMTTVKQPFGNLSGGGIGIIFPLKKGDRGWLEASDKDTTNFKQSETKDATVDPLTYSQSRYRFGYFTPDVINGFTVAESDKGCFLITNLNGGTKISVSPDGSMNVLMPTDTTFTTPTFTINGNLFVTGDVVAGTNQKISLTTHTHGGVQGGTSNTSTPNPQQQ